jgi:hypothetical protein
MRAQYGSIIGEITEVNKNFIELAYTDDFVAGWNYDLKLKNIKVDPKLCKILDNGLNSNWKINIKKFKNEVLGI